MSSWGICSRKLLGEINRREWSRREKLKRVKSKRETEESKHRNVALSRRESLRTENRKTRCVLVWENVRYCQSNKVLIKHSLTWLAMLDLSSLSRRPEPWTAFQTWNFRLKFFVWICLANRFGKNFSEKLLREVLMTHSLWVIAMSLIPSEPVLWNF